MVERVLNSLDNFFNTDLANAVMTPVQRLADKLAQWIATTDLATIIVVVLLLFIATFVIGYYTLLAA